MRLMLVAIVIVVLLLVDQFRFRRHSRVAKTSDLIVRALINAQLRSINPSFVGYIRLRSPLNPANRGA